MMEKVAYSNANVRRQDCLLDEINAVELLQTGEYGILSMVEGSENEMGGYGIPINYGWNGKNSIYFHCASEGHKLNCLSANSKVSFCIVGRTNVISNKFTTAYESVIVRGNVSAVLTDEECMKALILILDKYSPHDKEAGVKYAEKSFRRTAIMRLDITEISGKMKRVKP